MRSCNCLTPEYCDLICLGYLKHLVSTVLKNRSNAAGLTKKEQKKKIQEMMDDPLTVEVLENFVPANKKYKLVRNAFFAKQTGLVMFYCAAIDFVQGNLHTLYRKLLKK